MVKRKRHSVKYYNSVEDTQPSWPRENKLLIELRKQKLSGILCDVVFEYENIKLYSHACVLASFSPYMMKLLLLDHDNVSLQHDNSGSFKTPLKINLADILYQSSHICWKCFTNIVDFMYTSKIYMYNCHVSHIEYAATVLQISELISVCTKFKELEYKKSIFNVSKHDGNVTRSNIKNKIHHELKLSLLKFNRDAADSKNANNLHLCRTNINEYLESSGTAANKECQNPRKSKKFKSVQNSNRKRCELEMKNQHQKISESILEIKLHKNPDKKCVKKTLCKNYVSSNETDTINFNGHILADKSSFKIHSSIIKNSLTKPKFSITKSGIANESSETQIVNYNVSKSEDLSLASYESKDDKIITENNKCNTSTYTTENQCYSLNLLQENHIVVERTERLCSSNYIAEETTEIKDSVKSRQTEIYNTSRSKEEAQLNIPLTINRKQQSSDEKETSNNCDDISEENNTVNKRILNVEENVCRNQMTDLTVSELYISPIKNRDEKNELTNKQAVDDRKDVLLTAVAESLDSPIHHIIENISENDHNEISESYITYTKDNHESELNVFESKKENKMNIKSEFGGIKTKEKTKYCCEVCQYKTLKLSKIVEHLETNDHNQTFCCICMYTFSNNMKFKQHLKLHKETLPFQCLTCSKKFKSIYCFKTHKLSHSSKKTFVCSICNASFKHSCNLYTHTVREHSETPIEKYTCEHCGFTTPTKYKLVFHLQEHGFTLPVFTCSVSNCRFQTTKKNSFTKHEKTHFKTETFICETCGSTFLHAHNLKRHVREIHNLGSLKLHCSKCDYTTNRKDYLNSHMISHSKKEAKPDFEQKKRYVDRKSYKCEICEKRFANRANVQRHKITIHNLGVIKIKCSTCNYTTTRQDFYRKHVSKHNSTHVRKYRKLACKTTDHTVSLLETVNGNENVTCQPAENCSEMPKCSSEKSSISDNKTYLNKMENNNMEENNYLLSTQIIGIEETTLSPARTLSITGVTDDYNTVYVCEICGGIVVNEENLQIHKSEEHGVQHATVSQVVREDCCKSKISPEKLDRNNQTGNNTSVLIPVNESEVTNFKNNVTTHLENKNCVVLPHYNSNEQSILSIDQQKNDNLVDMNFSLPLVDSSTEAANEQTGQFCMQKDCMDKVEFNFGNEESMCCNVEPSEKQNEDSSLSNIRTLVQIEEMDELNVIDTSGTIKHPKQNYSDKSNLHYNVSSVCNTTQTSVSNFCNKLNSENCNINKTWSDNIQHVNIENTQPSTESCSNDVFSLHNVTDLNKTIILNETTGEINIIDNNSNVTNNSENGNLWQNASSSTWILDESTGTLTNVNICNKQTDESLALNDQQDLISFPNQNTTVILNEGTGELTFISLNSDMVEKNENSDMFGNSHYFEDDTQSNFSIDSQEDFTCDNISLPSPAVNNERNSVTEFLNELTGEINLCNFTGDNDSNTVNNTNYINDNFKKKKNDGMAWNSSSDEDEDLTFLNELTGEILQDTSKIDNKSNIHSDSVRMENNSLLGFGAKNNPNAGNKILNETTGELSVHLDDELTKESTDSMYLNEETGVVSWNTLNQVTSESNILDKNTDWFFENLQNDSLDSFTADDDNFPEQFQYNLFLNNPCKDLTLSVGSNDTLLNESTGELESKICNA